MKRFFQDIFSSLNASQSSRLLSANDDNDAHAFDLDAEVEPIPEATSASGLPGADTVFGDDFAADDDDDFGKTQTPLLFYI